jgi:hypothetical protein
MFYPGKFSCLRLLKQLLDLGIQVALITFERQHIVSTLLAAQGGYTFLAADSIDGDDAAVNIKHREQFRNSRNFVPSAPLITAKMAIAMISMSK